MSLFAYLHGTIQNKEITSGPSDRLVLDVSGVGFEIQVSRRTLVGLPAVGEKVTLPTSLSIKETEWNLFGFLSTAEKELFTLMQSVTGIGPKLALALVGTFSPSELSNAILNEDLKLITQAPGVGTKVAQRIVLELQNKISVWQEKHAQAETNMPSAPSTILEEVRSILGGLGYTSSEINLALSEANNVDKDVESLVKHSLKVLSLNPAN